MIENPLQDIYSSWPVVQLVREAESRKQKCVALSTSEAEYLALGLSVQEGI